LLPAACDRPRRPVRGPGRVERGASRHLPVRQPGPFHQLGQAAQDRGGRMNVPYDPRVRMIPVKQITVLNPRDRSKKKFGQIIGNIAKRGLKKPVTVALVELRGDEARYCLVCGQGRLEAFVALGQEDVPAIVIEGTKVDLLLMSLAENLARRQHTAT